MFLRSEDFCSVTVHLYKSYPYHRLLYPQAAGIQLYSLPPCHALCKWYIAVWDLGAMLEIFLESEDN